MGLEQVIKHLKKWKRDQDILLLEASSATVGLAAEALNVEEARIAKTMVLEGGEQPIIIVAAGDARLHNGKFKSTFGYKPKMLSADMVQAITGHPVGGVCPFGLPLAIPVYLDRSLKRFTTVFPACGTGNSAIELTCDELEEYAFSTDWIDVCKNWES